MQVEGVICGVMPAALQPGTRVERFLFLPCFWALVVAIWGWEGIFPVVSFKHHCSWEEEVITAAGNPEVLSAYVLAPQQPAGHRFS